ncbi:hypothetical protein DJ027_28555, partial [Bacillus cereus]
MTTVHSAWCRNPAPSTPIPFLRERPRMRYTPADIAHLLGQKFSPTPEQAAVISSSPGPLLVVAGAGAGKTETMAA